MTQAAMVETDGQLAKGIVMASRGEFAGKSVDDLASIANHEHREAVRSMADVVTHGIRVGEALLAVKEQLPKGAWGAWLAENFEASDWTAKLYVRFAKYRPALEAQGISCHSDAVALVKQLARADRISPEDDIARRREARRLHADGHSYSEIGRRLGVEASEARRWVNIKEVSAGRRQPLLPDNHLDQFITGLSRAREAAGHLGKAAWNKVLDALIEQAHKQARIGHECVCPRPLANEDLCLRCGKTAPSC